MLSTSTLNHDTMSLPRPSHLNRTSPASEQKKPTITHIDQNPTPIDNLSHFFSTDQEEIYPSCINDDLPQSLNAPQKTSLKRPLVP